jgi:phosphoribosylanthranilate isomerase
MFVKICGITNEEDALLAVAMGAHAVGFIFAPSTRQVAPQVAADIIKRLPPEIMTVGVFRDWAPQRVSDIANQAGLAAVQLHGHEPPEVARWLKGRVGVVIQAFAAGDERVGRAAEYGVDAVLLDSPNPGSAQVFDWSLASEVPQGQRVIIAGGLDPDNVKQAIIQTHCWGVDVASGVERAPGYKDPIKLREFIRAATAGFDELGDDEAGMGDLGGDDGGDHRFYDWQEEV